MEGVQAVTPSPRTRTGARLAPGWAWGRERLATTPGRLVLLAVLVVAGAVCFGVIASLAVHSRARAATAARVQTEPLLVQAVNLSTALSDANATAATTFLLGGLEPTDRRAQYLQDLRFASTSLATLTRDTGRSGATRAAVTTIAQQLPVYSGLVEAARANNRQGFPVGAAYLRQASVLLDGTILPAARHLYAREAGALSDDYARGVATAVLVVLAVTLVVALGLLAWSQRYLTTISRRIFNVPMVLATAVLAAVAAWALVGMVGEQNALVAAHRDSDAVEALSASRILLARAESDESLTLVARGSDQTDPIDFTHVKRLLAPPSGLISEAQAVAARAGIRAAGGDRIASEYAAFATSPTSARAGERLNADLEGRIATADAQFGIDAADSTSSLSGLAIAIPVLTAAAAALALLGLRQRLGEYR